MAGNARNAPELDVVVVGAGVVGLACAAALARRGRSVLIIEALDGIARETTSRNSEVVHAGIYYPAGSLKATLCTEGRASLYALCAERGIPHRKLGKLIVASEDSELAVLEDLQGRGRVNGVPGLEIVDGPTVGRLEPSVSAVAALHSPETGIVDAHALCLSYLAEAESLGVELLVRTRLTSVEPVPGGWRLDVSTADAAGESVCCAAVVNAAGLECDRVAALSGCDVDAEGLRLHLCKGDYFALSPGAPISLSRLIYPVPPSAGLGIHATLDLGGRLRFGPDAEFVDEPRYDVDPAKAEPFAAAARAYLPALTAEMLTPDYAGIRPRLTAPGEAPRDFVVRENSDRGRPGWVDCIGIESPGLTASPAIGERVGELLASL